MRIGIYILIILHVILIKFPSFSQRESTSPTLQDKYPKKSGNLRMSSSKFDLGRINTNEVRYDTIRLFNSGLLPINISLPLKMPLFYKVTIKNSPLPPGGDGYIALYYDASKKNDFGFVLDRIQFNTDDIDLPQKYINVSANIVEYFPNQILYDTINFNAHIPKTSFNFGKIRQGEKVSHIFKIYNIGKKPLILHKIKTNNACIKASFSKKNIASGDSAIIQSEYDSFGKIGKESRIFSLYINNPNMSEVNFEMLGEVFK